MAIDLVRASAYVETLDLSGIRRGLVSQDATADTGEVFDQAKAQARIVGSGIFSFAQGVDAEMRDAISNSALLAQLVANKRADFETAPLEWLKQYTDVLANVGWVIQDASNTTYTAQGTAADVNEKITEIMTAVLGPGATALKILTDTITALKAMTPSSPWITLFSHESIKARIARFQIGLVDTNPAGDVFIAFVACLIAAKSTITQLLVFKLQDQNASFQASSGKVSINRNALEQLSATIRAKTLIYQADYLSSIRDI